MKVSTLTTPIQHNTRSTCWSSDEKKKRYQYRKGRSKIVSICRWHDFIYVVFSVTKLCLILSNAWTAACQTSLPFTISQSLLKLMSIESVMPSNHLILYCSLLFLPFIFPSIRVFSSESALHIRWLEYWGLSFSISPSNEYSGLISFRIGWFGLLAVQATLKSLIQHHSLKASILWLSAFSMVQISYPYMNTGKMIASTICTFIGKVMSFLFNTPSRLFIAFLPRSKCLNFIAPVTILSDFGAQEKEICHCLHFFLIYLPWSDGARCHDLSFLNAEF